MDLLVFLLAAYGATNIITASRLFSPLREIVAANRFAIRLGADKFLYCPMCVGWWVGVALSSAIDIANSPSLLVSAFIAGCVASGFCWIIRVILYKLGEDSL